MIEPEVAFNDSDDNMRLQEDFVSYLVRRALERRAAELEVLERDTAPLERVTPPFLRLDYGDAISLLQHKGSATSGATTWRRRRIADRRGVRPAGIRDELSEGGEGVLHEGESGRSAHGSVRRPARARRVRRDHRRHPARG